MGVGKTAYIRFDVVTQIPLTPMAQNGVKLMFLYVGKYFSNKWPLFGYILGDLGTERMIILDEGYAFSRGRSGRCVWILLRMGIGQNICRVAPLSEVASHLI